MNLGKHISESLTAMKNHVFQITTSLAVLALSNSVLAQTAPPASQQFTRTTPTLDKVSEERRASLIRNEQNESPTQLNGRVPEITLIEVDNSHHAEARSPQLRIVAWNMERGRHWRKGVRLIRETPALRDADVILLSEMDLGMARSGNEHTVREMAAALEMNYAFAVEFLELSKGEKEEREHYPGENEWGYHGNAILCRYPLQNLRMLRLPGIDKWYGHFQNRLGGRNALLADIDIMGQRLTLCSTHLESGGRDGATRLMQGKLIIEALPENPVILGGDLNARPSEAVIDAIRQAGFAIDEGNDLKKYTLQRERNGKVILWAAYIDYLAVRGLEVIRDETSPAVIPAAYPPTPPSQMLGDHAIVTVKVRVMEKP